MHSYPGILLIFLLSSLGWGASSFGEDSIRLSSTTHTTVWEQRLSEVEQKLSQYDSYEVRPEGYAAEPTNYAGASFFFVKPHLKESFEATITNPVANTLQLVPLDTDYKLTPRIWVGASNRNGLGVRASYWQYDQAGNSQTLASDGLNLPGATVTTVIYPAAIIAPAAGDVLATNNSLLLHTLDLEGTKDFSLGSLEGRLGVGIRYARIDQVMSARALRGPVTIGALDWQREMEGVGPIVSADARQCLWEGLSAIGRVRGALLYGEKSLRRNVVGDITPALTAAPSNVQLNDADEVTAGFELGFGMEWKRRLASGQDLFLQAMYEGQLWTESGAPTLTFLGLEGFSLSTGLIW